MNLAIDIGNNLTKVGIFEGERIVQFQNYAPLTLVDVRELFETYPIESSIVADVSFYDESINDFLRASSRFMLLTHETEVPFVNRYLSPETLGKDRIALAAGAVDIFPDENVLAIDAGTCITYDF